MRWELSVSAVSLVVPGKNPKHFSIGQIIFVCFFFMWNRLRWSTFRDLGRLPFLIYPHQKRFIECNEDMWAEKIKELKWNRVARVAARLPKGGDENRKKETIAIKTWKCENCARDSAFGDILLFLIAQHIPASLECNCIIFCEIIISI